MGNLRVKLSDIFPASFDTNCGPSILGSLDRSPRLKSKRVLDCDTDTIWQVKGRRGEGGWVWRREKMKMLKKGPRSPTCKSVALESCQDRFRAIFWARTIKAYRIEAGGEQVATRSCQHAFDALIQTKHGSNKATGCARPRKRHWKKFDIVGRQHVSSAEFPHSPLASRATCSTVCAPS